MASDPHLRRMPPRPVVPARTVSNGWAARVAILALLVVVVSVLLVASQLARLTDGKTTSMPAFVDHALGAPQAQAPSTRRPASDLTTNPQGAVETSAIVADSIGAPRVV